MIYCSPCAHASEAEDCPPSSARDWAEQTAGRKLQQQQHKKQTVLMFTVCDVFLFSSSFARTDVHFDRLVISFQVRWF